MRLYTEVSPFSFFSAFMSALQNLKQRADKSRSPPLPSKLRNAFYLATIRFVMTESNSNSAYICLNQIPKKTLYYNSQNRICPFKNTFPSVLLSSDRPAPPVTHTGLTCSSFLFPSSCLFCCHFLISSMYKKTSWIFFSLLWRWLVVNMGAER